MGGPGIALLCRGQAWIRGFGVVILNWHALLLLETLIKKYQFNNNDFCELPVTGSSQVASGESALVVAGQELVCRGC